MISKFFFTNLRNSSVLLKRFNSQLSADKLLTAENQNNCVSCMQKAPAIRFNPKPTAYSAVLIPICVSNQGEISLLYTRRSGNLSRHVRQISFPGGILDKTDKDYEDCALRETEEEIGLHRSRVKIWGTGALIRPPHTAAIMPVLGLIENLSLNELKINPDEVDEAFTVPISTLVSPEIQRHTQFRGGYSSPAFLVDRTKRIWGLTAAMTGIFLSCFLPKGIYKTKVQYITPYSLPK